MQTSAEKSSRTTYLAAYTPPVFSVKTVDLTVDLWDSHAEIINEMHVVRQHEGALCLYGEDLDLREVLLDGRVLTSSEYALEDDRLIIQTCPSCCVLRLTTRIKPQENTALSGLYRSNGFFCTQCEAEGFRRITFFPDRPDVLAVYTTRIIADKSAYPVLLSNGNTIAKGDLPGGRHWVQWADPFPKPSYLFALVAGDLACLEDSFVTMSGKKVDLRLFVERGFEDQCDHAMSALKKAMRWDEEQYGREYDLSVFMIVAVSDFNMGAMENKGLNIFNTKYILARPDTATDTDFAGIDSVVAHEYFHNWTGNRVTCRDWFQLSLKEGLTVFRDQEFSRSLHSHEVNRIMDVKQLLAFQFPEDAGSMAHPVRPESYEEINNFYTATIYNKGAEVIRMQQTLLGKETFRAGMDLYFSRHDGQAVTIDDFVAAMQDAGNIDLTQFKRWYTQAGTPEVTANVAFEHRTLTITLSQSCRPTPESAHKAPFHIPVRIALFTQDAKSIPLENDVLSLRETTQSFVFTELDEKPLVSLLRDFSAPVQLHYAMTTQERLALLRVETNGYAAWQAMQQLALECLALGLQSERDFVSPAFIKVYEQVLEDNRRDPALRAELLALPGFEEAMAAIAGTEVIHLENTRNRFRATLGQALFPALCSQYDSLWANETHALDPLSCSRRKLRNVCLGLMMKAKEAESLSRCQQQFTQAKTMTDQLASFALLASASSVSVRCAAVDAFYTQWQHEPLVLDKWFAIQASSDVPDVLERVRTCLEHPAFSLKNPNKVRAVIGAFCTNNPRYFHAKDGSGYAFLVECLLKIDAINPQIAARLATAFTRWSRYDAPRQEQMQQALTRLSQASLSRDLQEMVSKSRR